MDVVFREFVPKTYHLAATHMIAIRPPEYFPRPEYVALMQQADRFILADTFQYSRQSFQNRSKLRNPKGWQWITVPLKGYAYGDPITDVGIDADDRWQERHWRSFMYNYRSTMYFEYYEERFRPIFEETEWQKLANLTCRSVAVVANLLDVETPLERASELPGAPTTLDAILAEVGAEDEPLLVPPELADIDDAEARDLRICTVDIPPYRQNFDGFEPGMSAMDYAFNDGPDAARHIADATTVTPKE